MLKHIVMCYCIVTTSILIWSKYHYLLENNYLNMLTIYYVLNLLIFVENFCMNDALLIMEELLTDWKLSGLSKISLLGFMTRFNNTHKIYFMINYRCRYDVYMKQLQVLSMERENFGEEIIALAHSPSTYVKKYKAFIINGYRFHTKDRELQRSTQNSGVAVEVNGGNGISQNLSLIHI